MVTIAAVASGDEDEELDLGAALFGHRHHRRRGRPQQLDAFDPERPRLGVQFSDGQKVTNIDGFHGHDDPPAGPVIHSGGGGAGDRDYHQEQWVWPLPPPGPAELRVRVAVRRDRPDPSRD